MGDIDQYLATKEPEYQLSQLAIQNKDYIENKEDTFTLHSEYAQLLVAIGRQKDAAEYFKTALEVMEESKYDQFWSSSYCSVGGQYACVLEYIGQINEAAEMYQAIMAINPNGLYIGDCAVFTHRKLKDYDKAEELYIKALQLHPSQSSIHLKYAGFLRHIRRNVAEAEKYYINAVEANPHNGDALGNYASFLHGVYSRIDQAEIYYVRAVEADDSNTNNLCNFGLFLSEERQSYENAEKMYKRALSTNPTHANTLYNYAVMLDTHLNEKERAEVLYRSCLAVQKRHAFALYNLAVLLEERYCRERTTGGDSKEKVATDKQKEEVCTFYRKAVEADPRDAVAMADYGRFLKTHMNDPENAEPIILAAAKLKGDSA